MAFDGKSQTGRRSGKRRRSTRSPQVDTSRKASKTASRASRSRSKDLASATATQKASQKVARNNARTNRRGVRTAEERRNSTRLDRRSNTARARSERTSVSRALVSASSQRPSSAAPPAFATRSRRRTSLSRNVPPRPAFSRSAPPNRRLQSPHQLQSPHPRHLQVVPDTPQRRVGTPSIESRGRRVRRHQPPSRVRKAVSPLIYALRLLVVGIGLGVIAGTVLSSIDPGLRQTAAKSSDGSEVAAVEQSAASVAPKGLRLGREMSGLKSQIESLIAANEGLTAGVFVVDLDSKSYLDINSRRRFSSASTIKLPILVALFEEIDAGNISLSESLTMTEDLIATEAGEMQFAPIGTQFSVLETATEMIRISDNTATNLLIDRLGGAAKLNQRFQAWGLQQTQLQNLLPDLEGTNTISPNDLVMLLGRINQGEIVSIRSRDRLLDILKTTQTNELLPQGIGPGASIAHKTGNIGKVIGDVGLIDMPSGKRYIIMAMVERPHGDYRADELIRSISAETYQFLEASGSTSEQMTPTVPHSNIADQEPKRAPSIMTTDP